MLVRVTLAGVLLLAAFLQLTNLGGAPVYIGWDEARFAVQGHSIATTGRDLNGHLAPLFFLNTDPLIQNNSSVMWWQPLLIYLIAGVLRIAPFSESSVRLPIAGLAVLNVWLIYLVARRLFSNPWYAVVAAVMLTLTPAHFIFGRMATDYFCPLPFALAWLWCLLCCIQSDRPWLPAVTGFVLGVGLYSYIASWIFMPFYVAVTIVVLWRSGKPLRAQAALAAGFTVPLLPLIPWLWGHPGIVSDIFRNYHVVTSLNVTERVALYWDYFNPSYLFFSGASDLMWATRRAGVFVVAVAVLLPCGIWSIWRWNPSIARTVLLVGFFFAPVPVVATLPQNPGYATARVLLAVPFGVLISVAGVEWLVAQRGSAGRIVAALLLLSIPIQFASFARDYFADYQVRSAYRFDNVNVRDVAAYVIASDASARVPAVYLSEDLGTGKSVQWKFHMVRNRRPDLWDRTQYLAAERFASNDIPSGSLLVVDINNRRLNDLLGPGRCSIVHVVKDVADEPAATILRKH